ncbi:non-ribosomal peptide synthetase [Kitasatospora sp. NPDC059747]|uniref:non-ribosomal peptide synthetase n=1 Tax=Kitasatospora sp. NPDC059747 TaxID=3346930 RepID=UPI0036603BBC
MPAADTVPALIARHAAERPHALAVTDGTTVLTYRELADAARKLATVLAARGIGPGRAVGLLCTRSTRLVVAQLAVWQAGGHVVPLDPAYPRPRIADMIADAGVELTLGDKALHAEAGLSDDRTLVLGERGTDEEPATRALPTTGPAATALVLFTSGSTGRPKGVRIPHGGIADLVTAPDGIRVGPRDRVLFHSAVTFDASTFELWAPLANGAAVAVSPADRPTSEELAADIERFGVTVLVLTTALFHHLAARQSRIFGVVRTLAVGGEALSPDHSAAVLRAFPWLELLNGYGPTEGTTFTTLHRVDPADCAGPVPIGRATGGARVLVLDEDLAPAPAGTVGELWIAGARVADGYLDRPELTAERFRELPGVGRAYRSGDLAARRPDGVLEFHGRVDHQVKVRGFRIEPEEVEHALLQFPEVAEAAVVVRGAGRPEAALTACVVPAEGTRPQAETLRARLAERLPSHLVPTAWAVLDALPLTGTGKVDRRALAESAPADGGTASAPGDAVTGEAVTGEAVELTPIQQVVAEAWERALGRRVTSPTADFLAEGGHSLLAMWVVDDLSGDIGVELSLAAFLADPTVAGQAELLERALRDAEAVAAAEAAADAEAVAGAEAQGVDR